MLVLSHRGLHDEHAENTLAAFDAAVRLGVDGIETDLRLSADGKVVLYHDRNSPDGQSVGTLSRSELSKRCGHDVPTVDEALTLFPQVLWNLEIKDFQNVDEIARYVAPLIAGKRILVTSFWHPAVVRFESIVEVERGALVANRPLEGREFLQGLASEGFSTIVWYYEFADESLIREAQTMGIRSFVYGVDTAEEHERLKSLSASGLITDHPRLVFGGFGGEL